ncbi:hypothetical protein ACFLQ0_00280 [Nitrospinota bacterium]
MSRKPHSTERIIGKLRGAEAEFVGLDDRPRHDETLFAFDIGVE